MTVVGGVKCSAKRQAQRRECAGVPLHLREEQAQRMLGRIEVARLADQVPQALQAERGHPIARGRGAVRSRLGSQDERFVIAAGEEERRR